MLLDIKAKDTICALSTFNGYSAIAIIRISGPLSYEILLNIFNKKDIKDLKAMHGEIIDQNKNLIDDVIVIYFPKNKSFTGQDYFEIHCHGNPIIIQQILSLLFAHNARLAKPGEFSLRAFLNKKIDLAQAEGISDLIHAQSEEAKDVALKALKGGLFQKIEPVRLIIINALAEIEARMDFPDEDLGHYDKEKLLVDLNRAVEIINELIKGADYSIKLREGARIVICGLPNAGKSSLLNRLVGKERAIVHENPGTTRDIIETKWQISGIPLTLIDVAGIRSLKDADQIEKIGILKAFLELEEAQLIIWLADATSDNPFADEVIMNKLASLKNTPVIKVLNKADLLQPSSSLLFEKNENSHLLISAKAGLNINELIFQIEKILLKDKPSEGMVVTRLRQKEEILNCKESLLLAIKALKDSLIDEIIASELRNSGTFLDSLLGKDLNEDVLDKIFSEFCIGK